MRINDRPRPGWHTGHAAQKSVSDEHPTDRPHDRQRAYCELHGFYLVHRLPAQCPFSRSNPLTAVEQLRAIGWEAMARGFSDPDVPEALELLYQADTCLDCVLRLAGHRTVGRLRRESGVAR